MIIINATANIVEQTIAIQVLSMVVFYNAKYYFIFGYSNRSKSSNHIYFQSLYSLFNSYSVSLYIHILFIFSMLSLLIYFSPPSSLLQSRYVITNPITLSFEFRVNSYFFRWCQQLLQLLTSFVSIDELQYILHDPKKKLQLIFPSHCNLVYYCVRLTLRTYIIYSFCHCFVFFIISGGYIFCSFFYLRFLVF